MDEIVGFLWSPAKHLWGSIVSEISAEYVIEKYCTYNFEDHLEKLEECVVGIYKTDDISIDKIKKVKLGSMRRFSNEFLMFYIKIDNPEYRKKKKTGNNISKVVERIKKKIRNKYKNNVVGYIHDIIIHLADNDKQTHEIESLIGQHQKFRQKEFINLKSLLNHQFIDGEFNRVDMLVRVYSANCYVEDENYDFEFYRKMQHLRVRRNGVTEFKKLIDSFEKAGFDEKYPIKCSRAYRLLDGSHRLALAYFNKCSFVPIRVYQNNRCPIYSVRWFESKKKFTSDEFSIIRDETKNLMEFLEEVG